MKIVSPNYRERASRECWLVREKGSSLEDFSLHRALSATDVEFTVSSDQEAGFGCLLVAHCKAVEIPDTSLENQDVPEGIPFHYDNKGDFYLDGNVEVGDYGYYSSLYNKTIISGCRVLRLMPDRSMWATF